MARHSAAAVADTSVWVPPTEWREVRPGVWEPPGYHASPWELTPPAVATEEDELREYVRCANSLPYFALHYAWTLHVDDPDGARPRRLPAYPYLREMLAQLQVPSNTLSEKSRQMLSSWVYMTAFLHDLLFVSHAPELVVSRRNREVDDGGAASTVDSLLGKLRFMHERLPRFLWHPFQYRRFHVQSLVTGSYVRGETGAGGQVARGPAYRRALHDEAAHSRHSELMFAGLRQSCKRGLHLNSTVNGKGNAFARLAHSKTTTFRKIRLHWTRHPEKAAGLACLCGWKSAATGPLPDAQFEAHRATCPRAKGPAPTNRWYREEQANSTPEQIASELDISYERSVSARVFDGYDSTRHFFDVAEQIHRRTGRPIGPPAVGEEDLAYRRRVLAGLIDPEKPIVLFWDFGVSDETFVGLGQVEDESRQATRWLDEVIDKGKDWAYYHAIVVTVWYPAILEACGWTPVTMRRWAERRRLDWSQRAAFVPDLQNELPRGCLPVFQAGDPTGKNRDSSLGSWIANLALADPPMILQRVPFTRDKSDDGSLLEWIDHCRQVVRRDAITVSSLCSRLADALGGWRWPTDKEGNVLPGRQLPKHDLHSHPATALVMGYRTRWRGELLATENRDRTAIELVGVAGEGDVTTERTEASLQWATRRRSIEPDLRRRNAGERDLYGTTDDADDEFEDD